MKLSALIPTQRTALADLAEHGALRRTSGGYRPSAPGDYCYHSTRSIAALVRAGLAQWTDGEREAQPTELGRDYARATDTTQRSVAA